MYFYQKLSYRGSCNEGLTTYIVSEKERHKSFVSHFGLSGTSQLFVCLQTSGSTASSFRGRLEKDGSQSSEAGTSSSLSRGKLCLG